MLGLVEYVKWHAIERKTTILKLPAGIWLYLADNDSLSVDNPWEIISSKLLENAVNNNSFIVVGDVSGEGIHQHIAMSLATVAASSSSPFSDKLKDSLRCVELLTCTDQASKRTVHSGMTIQMKVENSIVQNAVLGTFGLEKTFVIGRDNPTYTALQPQDSDRANMKLYQKALQFDDHSTIELENILTGITSLTFYCFVEHQNKMNAINFQAAVGESMEEYSRLFGLSTEAMDNILRFRLLQIKREKQPITIPLSENQTARLKDAIAMELYLLLVDWMVDQLNIMLSPSASDGHQEVVQQVTILQTCPLICHPSAKLDQLLRHFTHDKLETALFHQANYSLLELQYHELDTDTMLPLMEMGDWRRAWSRMEEVVHTLNDLAEMAHAQQDENFVHQCKKSSTLQSHFHRSFTSPMHFQVKHYKEVVEYYALGLVEANRRVETAVWKQLYEATSNNILKSILQDCNGATIKPPASEFNNRVNKVIHELKSASHIERMYCITTNPTLKPKTFDTDWVIKQLEKTSILEQLTIHHHAEVMQVEWTQDEFWQQFHFLLFFDPMFKELYKVSPEQDWRCHGVRKESCVKVLCDHINQAMVVQHVEVIRGKTKIFASDSTKQELTRAAAMKYDKAVSLILKVLKKLKEQCVLQVSIDQQEQALMTDPFIITDSVADDSTDDSSDEIHLDLGELLLFGIVHIVTFTNNAELLAQWRCKDESERMKIFKLVDLLMYLMLLLVLLNTLEMEAKFACEDDYWYL